LYHRSAGLSLPGPAIAVDESACGRYVIADVGALLLLINALELLILADVVLSWIMPDKRRFPRSLTTAITDPLYAPLHAVLKPEKTGGLDLSPLILLILLYFFESMLMRGAVGAW
jgi:YggT family protein